MTGLILAIGLATALGPDAAQDIGALLAARCVRCHGGGTTKGGLSLVDRNGMITGGESGPAITPGKPDESLLIEQITGAKPRMPRGGKPLSNAEVATLRRWIEQGAPWPAGLVLKERESEATPWWAVQPLEKPAIPKVADPRRARSPIDAFLLEKLADQGLSFQTEADRRTLIRRLSYDLIGLPPKPVEIAAFLEDPAPDAYERLVDRLLASPHYGERWGRHWLDIVHYGDTHGYDKDKRRLNAWPYRDEVIRSLNEDKPYVRFVAEQVAGDVLYPDDPRATIATGFVAAGPWDFVGHVELREGTVEKAKTRLLDRDDMLANTMSTFASLTVHCARCHDHKFDPIPQADYYRLQAVFAGVERGDRPYPDAANTREKATAEAGGAALPPSPLVYALKSIAPRPIHILNRGEVEHPGAVIGPGAPACVPNLESRFPESDAEGDRRAALARWLTDHGNVLVWRSIVNRVWQFHFGRGIVDTPNDFGHNGATPSHPELLDWLAVTFRDDLAGSLKRLHRLIVTSAAYRQSSAHANAAAEIDADNRLLWRQDRRRLEAEAVRDAVLSASGELDQRMGGPGFAVFRYKDDHSPIYDHDDPAAINAPEGKRRAIYRFIVRSVPDPFLNCLDGADPNANVPIRNTTITALQALTLLNDPFMIVQAEAFENRLKAGGATVEAQLTEAFLLTLGRPPRAEELTALAALVRRDGMASACRLVLNLNEFVFID